MQCRPVDGPYGCRNHLVYNWPGGVYSILFDFELSMLVLGVGRGPIGFVAPWRFKTLDSQSQKSNMGPVLVDFHDFRIFRKSGEVSLARYLSCFRPGAPKHRFSSFSVGTKKMHGEKLCRFVVVSPREVPYSTFSCLFKIFKFRSFLKASPLRLFQSRESSVH